LSLVTSDDEREEVDEKLTADYELGQFIREKLIPRATLYFTGEAQLLEKMFDSSSEDETDEEEVHRFTIYFFRVFHNNFSEHRVKKLIFF
jgi:hypothetical protein